MARTLASLTCLAGGVLAAAIAVHGQGAAVWQPPDANGQGQTPIMPVQQEPHHRQLFLYGHTRLIDLQIPPGDASWFHTHDWPVFYLTVADSQTRTQVFGQDWGGAGRGRGAARGGAPGGAARGAAPGAGAAAAPGGAPRAGGPPAPGAGGPPAGRAAGAAPGAGDPGARGGGAAPAGGRGFRPRLMSNIEYAKAPVTHRIENIGTGLYRALGVINESKGGDESVTEEMAGFTGKAESTNAWFRTYRVALAPGEKTPAHQHKAPVVILQDTTGKGLAAGAMNFELSEPGSWGFFDAGVRHEISNTGDGRLEVLEVEVRTR